MKTQRFSYFAGFAAQEANARGKTHKSSKKWRSATFSTVSNPPDDRGILLLWNYCVRPVPAPSVEFAESGFARLNVPSSFAFSSY